MSFLYPAVVWFGLPVIALPVIIHLLNLRRQRKVPWAAMSFLLESQQQSKTWINLQEWLLLLLRTAAIALLVLMLARPTTSSGWIGRLMNRPVHHLVLLDDSYSMTDRWAETTAWQEALGAVTDVVRSAADQSAASLVTVVRFSETTTTGDDPRPALFRQRLDDASREQLNARLASLQCSESAPRLLQALSRAITLAELQSADEDLVVHVISDFRQQDLAELDKIEQAVAQLGTQSQHLQIVRCVRQAHTNLAVTALAPERGNRAAGVETWMNVVVQNFGDTVADEVVVQLEQDGTPLVGVPLGNIAGGETAERRFRVTFADEGAHHVTASIDADAVALDNTRHFATDIPASQRVLLIDGSPRMWESYYLSTALAPSRSIKSGWQADVMPAAELATVATLDDYAAIALLDVPALTDEQQQRLLAFVKRGGGLFVTLGESSRRDYYAGDAYNDGAGFMPVPVNLPTQWLRNSDGQRTDDLRVSDHPLFKIFRGERNSMLSLMKVNYYYSIAPSWQPSAEVNLNTKTIATLANGTPLVVEKQLGAGTVVAQLTKISPDQGELGSWTNWGPNPAFVVLANELFGYLANGRALDRVSQVGETIRTPLDRRAFSAAGTIVRSAAGAPFQANLVADASSEDFVLVSPPIKRAGLYLLNLQRTGGAVETRLAAVNPDAREGDLALVADSTLRQKLLAENISLRYADELASESNPTESAWSELLLAVLVLALVAEQALAYVCSFHE